MAAESAQRPLMIRAPGYLSLCVGVLVTLLAVSVGALVDPALDGTRDPDWMFWIWAPGLTALVLRAPFVGLRIAHVRVARRTWFRSVTYPMASVLKVKTTGCSGYLNGYVSTSKGFTMLRLHLPNGRKVDVPEVTGGSRATSRRLAIAQHTSGLEGRQAGRHEGAAADGALPE